MLKCYYSNKKGTSVFMETRETSPRIIHAVVGVVHPLLLSKWCSGTMV
jgi:hypothetical protein